MTAQSVVLTGREAIAENTWAFHFRKPAGFSFKSGQAIDLVLADPPPAGAANIRHAFSLVSAPFEQRLTIATRLRGSGFKDALAALPAGAAVAVDGPFGSLTLHSSSVRPAVLLAGGIGITPFISMLRQATHDGHSQRFTLVYSSRSPEDAAFLTELQALERVNPLIRLVPTMTRLNGAVRGWSGRTGRLDRDLIRSVSADASKPVFYVAGSPAMVAATRQLLANARIDDDDVRSEEFFGY